MSMVYEDLVRGGALRSEGLAEEVQHDRDAQERRDRHDDGGEQRQQRHHDDDLHGGA
jgi:hypothetical protein